MSVQKTIFSFLLLLVVQVGWSQAIQFDKLRIPVVPAGWSNQTTTQGLVYDNYNVRGSTRFVVTILKGQPFTGKQDAAFAYSWKKWMQTSDTAMVPKFRKSYNAASAPMATGGIETTGEFGKGFYQLSIYQCNGYLQAIGVYTISQKIYRAEFYDWNTYLMDVQCL